MPTRFLAVCIFGAILALGALPSIAAAEGEEGSALACISAPLEVPEEVAQPEREVRSLRNDVGGLCEQERLHGSQELERLEGIETEVQTMIQAEQETRDQVAALAEQLAAPAGTPVRIAGSEAVVETRDSVPAEVTMEGNFEGLEQAVVSGTETGNSNLWGLAGLFVGFLALAAFYKLVRP